MSVMYQICDCEEIKDHHEASGNQNLRTKFHIPDKCNSKMYPTPYLVFLDSILQISMTFEIVLKWTNKAIQLS